LIFFYLSRRLEYARSMCLELCKKLCCVVLILPLLAGCSNNASISGSYDKATLTIKKTIASYIRDAALLGVASVALGSNALFTSYSPELNLPEILWIY